MATDLTRTLPVDIEKHINPFVECVFNPHPRSAVIVAKHFCVFEEFPFADKLNEMFFLDKMVMNAILFAGAHTTRGM
ncbi:Uncharacterised protein [Vibrio cholerae]|nr:Uncharacterised protein [Vibrio cholerae]